MEKQKPKEMGGGKACYASRPWGRKGDGMKKKTLMKDGSISTGLQLQLKPMYLSLEEVATFLIAYNVHYENNEVVTIIKNMTKRQLNNAVSDFIMDKGTETAPYLVEESKKDSLIPIVIGILRKKYAFPDK